MNSQFFDRHQRRSRDTAEVGFVFGPQGDEFLAALFLVGLYWHIELVQLVVELIENRDRIGIELATGPVFDRPVADAVLSR